MNRIIRGGYNRINRLIKFILFKLKYPNVPVVRPLAVGTFYSQDGQDLFLSSLLFNYLTNNSSSWIVDVGCNHPQHFSNSLFFERAFNCRTLAVDPLVEFSDLWANQRPSAIFINAAIGGTPNSVVLRVPSGTNADNMFAALEGGHFKKELGGDYIERTVRCMKLSELFESHCITEVLLLSIDVEGFELEVLKTIDLKKCMIRCIVLENNSCSLYGSDDIREYLHSLDFAFYARIGVLDDVFVHSSLMNGRNAY